MALWSVNSQTTTLVSYLLELKKMLVIGKMFRFFELARRTISYLNKPGPWKIITTTKQSFPVNVELLKTPFQAN
jgi:hypothetical protein